MKGFNYALAFVASKTYYDLEMALTLPGVICFYGVVGLLGYVISLKTIIDFNNKAIVHHNHHFFYYRVIVMYFYLPETENRSLEDIEHFFSDRSRKMTDIKIHKNAAREHYLAKHKALDATEEKY